MRNKDPPQKTIPQIVASLANPPKHYDYRPFDFSSVTILFFKEENSMQKIESIQTDPLAKLSNEVLLLTVKDVQQALQLGKNAAYRLMNSKTFPTIHIGGKLFVGRVQLLEWIANQSGRYVLI